MKTYLTTLAYLVMPPKMPPSTKKVRAGHHYHILVHTAEFFNAKSSTFGFSFIYKCTKIFQLQGTLCFGCLCHNPPTVGTLSLLTLHQTRLILCSVLPFLGNSWIHPDQKLSLYRAGNLLISQYYAFSWLHISQRCAELSL